MHDDAARAHYDQGMPTWRQQTLIDAPVEAVWRLVGDPSRYPEYAAGVVAVTGSGATEVSDTFEQVSRTPMGERTTTFAVTELEELRAIRLQCQTSGYYSRWLLTEAQDASFVDLELGVEPTSLQYRLMFGAAGKRYLRRLADETLEGLQRAANAEAEEG